MINGHWQQWAEEARQHWHQILTAGTVIKDALPVQEWIRTAVIALVTAVVTSQITIARLDERIIALGDKFSSLRSERELIIKRRDEQVARVESKIDRLESSLRLVEREHAKLLK